MPCPMHGTPAESTWLEAVAGDEALEEPPSAVQPDLPADRDVAPRADPAQAEAFLWRFHTENGLEGFNPRLEQVRAQITNTGSYTHTGPELSWACRVAWRTAARCIGRAAWASLIVRDRRHVTDAAGIAAESIAHALEATNGGRIRSTMTVFAAAAPGQHGPRIWNEQIIRYAGDPAYAWLRKAAEQRGWSWNSDPWAVLPLLVDTGHGTGPELVDVPAEAVLEVPLSHPEHSWFAELGMRWHALPAITGMRLEAGGLWYPAAPFNGWYVETEIAAANLAHPDRFDMLPVVADRLGLDRSARWVDWRDRATLVLNEAVLSSFQQAGVSISAKRKEADRLLAHLGREHAAGRDSEESVDWSWVNLPSAYPLATYHRYYQQQELDPALVWNELPGPLKEGRLHP